ncbi:hypothetical protein CDAR_561171 [Caerostris darwini]|uniref:Uncharacterized protein n=1 Tax=Caerostris darwini TaxID=1538125 RepID=A0AAV4TAY1_9ARAC|nr:hypothetical protein CDAR_561171 [Caerostris darwini]
MRTIYFNDIERSKRDDDGNWRTIEVTFFRRLVMSSTKTFKDHFSALIGYFGENPKSKIPTNTTKLI